MNSMTGFGSGQADSHDLGTISVELRTVNNRFLDLTLKLSQELSPLEPAIRARLQKRLTRGKVYVSIRFVPVPGATERYELNEVLLDRLIMFCNQRDWKTSAEALLGIDGIVKIETDDSRREELEALVGKALDEAVKSLETERRREGDLLRLALVGLHTEMKSRIALIDQARPLVVEKFRQRLVERIAELLGPQSATLDPGRLEQEIAMFADRADISEELTRLDAHLGHLEELLSPDNREARGRALDFLAQEILREVNTIGSKARDLDITRQVLELKNNVESLKEQIANVE